MPLLLAILGPIRVECIDPRTAPPPNLKWPSTGRSKALLVAIAACAGLALAAVVIWSRQPQLSRVPAAPVSGSLPAPLERALRTARARVAESNYGTEQVRALAHLYHANRLYEEARSCYRLVGEKPGGMSAQDHYYMADLEQYAGNLEAAAVELRAVLASAPDYLPARLALGNVLFKLGEPDAAEAEYRAALAAEKDQPQAMFALARIELNKGEEDAAVARLDALMASHPEMTSGAGLLAQLLDRRGADRERVAEMTHRSRQRPEPGPEDAWMDALLADCYDKQSLGLKFEEYFACGQIDRAVPLLSRFEELDPRSAIPAMLRGAMHARVHDDAGAVREYRAALEKGASPDKLCPYIEQAMVALGDLSGAAGILAGYYAKEPDSIPILTAYADVAVRQGDTALARTLLTRLLDREPYLVAENMSLAKILWTAGERDKAAACLERAARVSAKDVLARSFLGEYYLGKGDPVSAIAPLEQALANGGPQAPSAGRLSAMLTAAYLEAGDAEAARGDLAGAASGYYEKATRVAPADPSGYARIARAWARLGRFRDAAQALERLRSLQPGNPTVYLSLGDVEFQEGDKDAARRDWQRAYELADPGNAALRGALNDRLNGPITEDTFK